MSPTDAERLREMCECAAPLAESAADVLYRAWRMLSPEALDDPTLLHLALTALNASRLLCDELERRAALTEEPR